LGHSTDYTVAAPKGQPFGEPWIAADHPADDGSKAMPAVGLYPNDGNFRSSCEPPHRNTGFLDFNIHWDTRDFASTTLNAGAKLPNDFEYFQLLNLDSAIDSGAYDWTSFYTEINLRRRISKDNDYLKPFDWTVQYADGSTARGVLRFGTRWRLPDTAGTVGYIFKELLNLKYNVSFYLIETDGTGWQMEHTYRRTFFDDRMYVAAFLDHNINRVGSSTWVTEHQVGLRLVDQLHAVAEYRFKSTAPAGFESGWAFGLEYVIGFV
jgi:hypothetical protein